MAGYISIYKGGEPEPYTCKTCGGTYTGPHYCPGSHQHEETES